MSNAITLPDIQQGADYALELKNYWKCDGQADQPIDRSGSTALMQLRRTTQSPAVATFTHTSGITFDGAQGIIRIKLLAAATALILPGVYYFDLKLAKTISGELRTERLIEGKVQVTPEVSRGV